MIADLPPGPRAELARAAAARGEDFAGLSRLLGRNPAYIQQFVRRGIPRKLDGDDRAVLARYLGIDEALLGGEPQAARAGGGDALVTVPRLALEASAGPGAVADEEAPRDRIGFSRGFLREVTGGRVAGVAVLSVAGDSMQPTLGPGDDILVVRREVGEPIRDGVHVLRADDLLLVKRLMLQPGGGLAIVSDNKAYPERHARLDEVDVIGRVVWAGRRF